MAVRVGSVKPRVSACTWLQTLAKGDQMRACEYLPAEGRSDVVSCTTPSAQEKPRSVPRVSFPAVRLYPLEGLQRANDRSEGPLPKGALGLWISVTLALSTSFGVSSFPSVLLQRQLQTGPFATCSSRNLVLGAPAACW